MIRSKPRKRRRTSDTPDRVWTGAHPLHRGHDDEGTPLHDQRLGRVVELLLESGAATVLDLGCGSGSLLERLVPERQFNRIAGVDTSAEALLFAGRRLSIEQGDDRITLYHHSFTSPDRNLIGFDAAAMVETIEHVEPAELSRVEITVFARLRPALVLMTTPNHDYNPMFGLAEGEYRHPDHRFEWSRARFRSWATGVAERNEYEISFEEIGHSHPILGAPTQMAVFRLAARTSLLGT